MAGLLATFCCRRRNCVAKTVPSAALLVKPEAEIQSSVLRRVTRSASAAEAEEWEIVAKGISTEEFLQLVRLHEELHDCASHPACSGQPLHRQPEVLLRFLRARNGNITQAGLMFRAHLDWRKEEDVENKLASVREELARKRTLRSRLLASNQLVTDIGIDSYGVPIKLVRMARIDMAALRETVERADSEGGLPGPDFWMKVWLLQTHDERQVLRSTMQNVCQFIPGYVIVVDVSSHGINGWYSRVAFYLRCFVKEAIQLFEPNYPEQARAYLVCGASPPFMALYSVVKRFIKPDLRRKYQLFRNGSDLGPVLRQMLGDKCAPLPLFLESDSAEAQAEAAAGMSSKFFPPLAVGVRTESAAWPGGKHSQVSKTRGCCLCWPVAAQPHISKAAGPSAL